MIRFSALLVVVATGMLIAGVIASRLALVYIAIAVSAVALIVLGVGAGLKRDELFGKPAAAESGEVPQPERVEPVAAAAATAAAPASAAASASASAAWGADSFPASSGGWTAGNWGEAAEAAGASAAPAAKEPWSGLPEAGRFETKPAAFAPFTPVVRPAEPARAAWPPAPEVVKGDETAAVPSLSQAATVAEEDKHSEPPADSAPSELNVVAEAAAEAVAATTPATDEPAADETDEPASAEHTPTVSAAVIAEPTPTVSVAALAEPTAGPELSADAPPETPPETEPETEPGTGTPAEATPATDTEPAADEDAPADIEASADTEVADDATPTTAAAAVAAPAVTEAASSEDGQTSEGASEPDPTREVTVVPGVPRYHNASCILIRFMGDNDLEKMTLGDARAAGCTPCRACLPDQETD